MVPVQLPLVLGWCVFTLIFLAWAVARSDGRGSALFPSVVCAIVYAAVSITMTIVLEGADDRIAILVAGELAAGMALGLLLRVRPSVPAAALGVFLVGAGIPFHVHVSLWSDRALPHVLFVLGSLAVEAAVLWGFFMAGVFTAMRVRRGQPHRTIDGTTEICRGR